MTPPSIVHAVWKRRAETRPCRPKSTPLIGDVLPASKTRADPPVKSMQTSETAIWHGPANTPVMLRTRPMRPAPGVHRLNRSAAKVRLPRSGGNDAEMDSPVVRVPGRCGAARVSRSCERRRPLKNSGAARKISSPAVASFLAMTSGFGSKGPTQRASPSARWSSGSMASGSWRRARCRSNGLNRLVAASDCLTPPPIGSPRCARNPTRRSFAVLSRSPSLAHSGGGCRRPANQTGVEKWTRLYFARHRPCRTVARRRRILRQTPGVSPPFSACRR